MVLASELPRLADARLRLATITAVTVSKDLRHAKVYWSTCGGKAEVEPTAEAFERSAAHLRKVLAGELEARFVPSLKFYYDDTLDTVEEVERLLERAHEKDSAAE